MMVSGGFAVMCDSLCRWGRECGNSENLGFYRTQGRAGIEAISRGWKREERHGRGVKWACPECVEAYGDNVFSNWRDKP